MFTKLDLLNWRRFKRLCSFGLLPLFLINGFSTSAEDVYIPPSLEEWKDWVLADHPRVECPINDTNHRRLGCVWISELAISAESTGKIQFKINGVAYANGPIGLPYGSEFPHSVRLNGRTALVGSVNRQKIPAVHLTKGRFVLEGRLDFDKLPRTINVPNIAATLSLDLDGKSVPTPRVENSRLWLQTVDRVNADQDRLSVDVYRKLVDNIPQTLETRIRLTVDGRDRVVYLGDPMPDGMKLVEIDSAVPVQVDTVGEVLVQVSRGEHWITFRSIREGIANEFALIENPPNWPSSEFWAVETVTQHRAVDVEGVAAVDPNIVESPFGDASTYLLKAGDTLQLRNEIRGDPNPKPASFEIYRDYWLAFDGSYMKVLDRLKIDTQTEIRLTTDFELGSVSVDGNPRMITFVDSGENVEPGVSIQPNENEIKSLSVLPRQDKLSINGWQVPIDNPSASLHLPPGWKLLWASGVDYVQGSWLSSWWNLWDIFFCVLLIIVIYRVGGLVLAIVSLIVLLLSYQQFPIPALGWFALALLALLMTNIKKPEIKSVVNIVYWLVLIPVAFITIYVSAVNLRQAIYPQLEAREVIDLMHYDTQPDRVERQVNTAQKVNEDGIEEMVVTGNFLLRSDFNLDRSYSRNEATINRRAIDPELYESLAIQTGPGLPQWFWNQARLDWSGPVGKDQKFSLTIMPPYMTRAVFVVIALLHLLVLVFFIAASTNLSKTLPPWVKRALPFLTATLLASSAAAEIPDSRILDELATRLTAMPECVPGCSSLEKAALQMTNADELSLVLTYPSTDSVAVPIPQAEPVTTLRDVKRGTSTEPLLRTSDSSRFVTLDPGMNVLTMDFDLRGIDDFVLSFPMKPAVLTDDICCWAFTQSAESGKKKIVMNRRETVTDELALKASTYDFRNHVTVIRELDLTFEPNITTRVRAQNNPTTPITLEIPLLDGETVLSENTVVNDGNAVIQLSSNRTRVSWQSGLVLGDSLILTAPEHGKWSEVWHVRGSDFWRAEITGITPSQSRRGFAVIKPRTGESATLSLTQPVPQPGSTSTVNLVRVWFDYGERSHNGSMDLKIEASVAQEFYVTLPDGAVVEQVLAAESGSQPLTEGNIVKLPLSIGIHDYYIGWQSQQPVSIFNRTPVIELSSGSTNTYLQIVEPWDRWVLLLGGPAIGPAVLFWGMVLATVLVALALAQLPNFPIRKVDAVLLALGATLANIWALLFVTIWAVGIWWRGRMNVDVVSDRNFRLLQVATWAITGLGVAALIFTVVNALFTPANMYVSTFDSGSLQTSFQRSLKHVGLVWYSDVSDTILPTAWMLSLPRWVYQLTMLGWSLWLAFALVRWVRTSVVTITNPVPWRSTKKTNADDGNEPKELESQEASSDPQPDPA